MIFFRVALGPLSVVLTSQAIVSLKCALIISSPKTIGTKRIKQMGTSIGIIEKHYSKFIPNMAAAMLAGNRYEDKLGLKNTSV